MEQVSSTGPKHEVFACFAEVAKAMGHAHRLELLEHIGQGERGVEVLAARAGLTFANTSRHLQHLKRARLVAVRRAGKRVLYRLADDSVVDLISALRRFSERNVAEVRKVVTTFFQARDSLEPISREALIERLRDGLTTVLDVRPEDEFELGHVPGAINIPLADLHRRLADLSPDREIIAYCRGAYCVFSFEAVAALRARGFNARRLQDGYPEWRVAGLPVEAGPTPTGSAAD